MNENETQTMATSGEALLEALRAQTAQVKVLVDAYADMGHAAAEVVRKTVAARNRVAPPPPVSAQLHRFATLLADKATATVALLTDEQRARLGAIVPSFTSAALADEPDVIAMVASWLDLAPDEIARDLASSIDDLERRFAA